MRKYIFLFSCIIILSISGIQAQPYPMKYGKIDTADLKMKVYKPDSTAKAVVLCNFGVFDPMNFSFTGHLRIKILKKEDAWFANQMFYTSAKSDIRGCTYNWKNGQVVETRLKDESIFTERVRENWYRFRVTMPEIMDGSIIEIQYTFNGLPHEWRFQDRIPVRWSELRIPYSSYFTINSISFGFMPLYIHETERWVGKDMPAILEEPYVNSITNYLSKLEIEITKITIPRYYHASFTTSWDDVNTNLGAHDLFGMPLAEAGLFLAPATKEIKNHCTSQMSTVKAAYEYIKKQIAWNKESSVYTTASLTAAFNKKSGNSADVNLSLIKLLRKLDIEVYPIVLSTREHGILSPTFPTLLKFNYVIACAFIDGKEMLLDATEKHLAPGILPERCLNGMGRILYKERSDWYDLKAAKSYKEITYGNYVIDDKGTIAGSLSRGYLDYAACNFRESYEKFNSRDEYISDFESKSPGFTVDSLSVSNIDSLDLPVKTVFHLTINNQIEDMGNMINFNPFLLDKIKDTPFKLEKRQYPVDFSFPREYKYTAVFKLPDGYTAEEIPEAVNIVMPDKKARFSYKVTVSEGLIRIGSSLEIPCVVFGENEYTLLKQFYNQVMSKQNESIILKKTSL